MRLFLDGIIYDEDPIVLFVRIVIVVYKCVVTVMNFKNA